MKYKNLTFLYALYSPIIIVIFLLHTLKTTSYDFCFSKHNQENSRKVCCIYPYFYSFCPSFPMLQDSFFYHILFWQLSLVIVSGQICWKQILSFPSLESQLTSLYSWSIFLLDIEYCIDNSSSPWKVLCHFFMTSLFLMRNQSFELFVSQVICHFSLLSSLFLFHWFSEVCDVFWCGFWGLSCLELHSFLNLFMSFAKFGKFLEIISLNTFLAPIFFYLSFWKSTDEC